MVPPNLNQCDYAATMEFGTMVLAKKIAKNGQQLLSFIKCKMLNPPFNQQGENAGFSG